MKDTFYNLQFEEETVYYAEGLKMDALSPNYCNDKLPKSLYFNKLKHDKRLFIKDENDPKRNKPKMIPYYPISEMKIEVQTQKVNPVPKFIDVQTMVIQGKKGPTIIPVRGGYGAVPRKKSLLF